MWAVVATACTDGDDGTAATTTSTTLVSSTTTTFPEGMIRTATGAADGPADPRVGAPGDGRPVDELVLQPGQCFNEAITETDEGQARTSWGVSCAGPHDAEVYHVATHPAAPEAIYPGEQEMEDFAVAACFEAFEPWTGTSYALSELEIGIMRPVASTWSEGDRRVQCSTHDQALEPLVGSTQGSRRLAVASTRTHTARTDHTARTGPHRSNWTAQNATGGTIRGPERVVLEHRSGLP